MGVVYRARDTRLGRIVAVKILPAEALAKSDRKLRFVQEARTASALNHANIVTVYDIDACDGRDFIAMECKTLGAWIGECSGVRRYGDLAVLCKPMIGKRPSNSANETRQQNQAEHNIAGRTAGYSALNSRGNKPPQPDDRCRSGHSANVKSQGCHYPCVDQYPR